ncbi:MAG: hypothetical protein OHK0029_35750 [Armatimonadaceae bacterium]
MLSSRFFSAAGVSLLALTLSVGAAHAQTVSGSATGIFENSVGTNFRGNGTNRVEWSRFNNVNEASLTFTGSAFGSTVDSPFSIGSLTFVNRVNPLASLDATSLKATVIFTQPVGNTSSYTFDLELSKNFLAPDTVEFTLASTSQQFLIGNTGYFLTLNGFSNGVGGFTNSFAVADGQTGSSNVFVTVSAVPEPGEYAVMGVIGLPLAGLMIRARRTRRA